MERELLKSEKGFEELMKTFEKFFMKDKDSEKLEKATIYFSAYRKKGNRFSITTRKNKN